MANTAGEKKKAYRNKLRVVAMGMTNYFSE